MSKTTIISIINRLLSPIAILLYLFTILLFGNSIFSIIPIESKALILSIIIGLNMILPLLIERFLKNRRIIQFVLNSFLLIVSTVLVSGFLPAKIVPIIFLCAFWIIALKTLFNIDTMTSSWGAFAFLLYTITLSMNADLTLYFIGAVILIGAIISMKLYLNSIQLKKALLSLLSGICCAVFASIFL